MSAASGQISRFFAIPVDPNERVEADDGYLAEEPDTCKCPGGFASRMDKSAGEFRRRIRTRHETVNARFKSFGILKQTYRHNLINHGNIFRAVAVLTQLAIENGEPLFVL